MTPYIVLIIITFLLKGFANQLYQASSPQADRFFLRSVFVYLFFFCVLREYSVGRDIPGYVSMYDYTANVRWDNWKYVYYENGYIALLKICNYLGLTARGFFYVVYFIILFPIYRFFRKYSLNPLLSVLIFIGYQFFTFDLTGIRQAIAMSIVLIAFQYALKNGWANFIKFAAILFIASMFHRSALIFIFAYPAIRLPINIKTLILYIVAAGCCYALNKIGVNAILEYFDNEHYSYSNDDSQQLGLSLILMASFTIATYISYFKIKRGTKLSDMCRYCANMLMMAMVFLLLLNGSVLLRSTMYYYIIITIALPIFVSRLDNVGRLMASIAIIALMLMNFFMFDLPAFNMIPYEIGTSQAIFK